MTREDKELLLKDLSARLPYEVKFYVDNTIPPIPSEEDHRTGRVHYVLTATGLDIKNECIYTEETGMDSVLFVKRHGEEIQVLKPYLRPMSSMTDEEKNELLQLMGRGMDIERVDFYISHHFDHRSLIPMGLALEAPEEMYK